MDNKEIQRNILQFLYDLRINDMESEASAIFIIDRLRLNSKNFTFNIEYLKEKGFVSIKPNGFKKYLYYIITANGMDIVTSESLLPDKSGTTIHQIFKGKVGNVAGRDITINNITANIYLHALEIAIEKSEDIPDNQKKDLVQKIRDIKDNPIIVSLGTTAITEAIKQLLIPS